VSEAVVKKVYLAGAEYSDPFCK